MLPQYGRPARKAVPGEVQIGPRRPLVNDGVRSSRINRVLLFFEARLGMPVRTASPEPRDAVPHRRRLPSLATLVLAALPGLAWAQLDPRTTMPRPTREREAAISTPLPQRANPVVAGVDGYPIHLDDLGQAIQTLPENLRGMPFETLYPVLVDRLVDHQSLVIMAKRAGLEDSPHVQREIRRATERILEAAYLEQETRAKATDEAVRDAYQRGFANRPAIEKLRARHILLGSEAEARKVIADLRQGTDFALLARTLSKDPTGANGGDVGFFHRDQVWAALGDLSFALQPGQIGNDPIRNEFGWHVVRVEERRLVAAPSLSELEAGLRRELLTRAVKEAIDRARGQVIIRRFNLDGSGLDTGPRLTPAVAPEQTSADAPDRPAGSVIPQFRAPKWVTGMRAGSVWRLRRNQCDTRRPTDSRGVEAAGAWYNQPAAIPAPATRLPAAAPRRPRPRRACTRSPTPYRSCSARPRNRPATGPPTARATGTP